MTERKHFLDWLRVIAFGLLTVFHVGLMYASWGYVFKSPRLVPDIEWILILFSPWRIVLLFFISGVACRFLMNKRSPGAFTSDRVLRLLPVIVLGMLIVNPTQNYIELLSEGAIDAGYFDFWFGSYLTSASFPGRLFPTWDHLWFLVYLLAYILALATVYALVPGAFRAHSEKRLPVSVLVVAPALWLAFTNHLVEDIQPSTFGFVDDWAVHFRSVGFFGIGVIVAFHDRFWDWCRRHRARLLLVSGVLFSLFATQRVLSQMQAFSPFLHALTRSVATGFYGWSMILTLAGFTSRYLSSKSGVLSYLTVAILPVYVLHQPVMIFVAWQLFPLELPLVIEGALLVAATSAGSLVLYELLIRRFNPVRLAFGLRKGT